MGYYTYYTLNMWDEEGNELKSAVSEMLKKELVIKFIEAGDTPENAEEIVKDLCSYGCELKWYESDEDMTSLAKKFPYIKFELEGRGEDGTDWWVAQYWGDKTETVCAQRPTPHLF